MKKINTIYWVFTVLFALAMFSTAIPDVIMNVDAVKFMATLGYPKYFIPFIGVAKMLGAIAILIPGFPRIKEWAYAGLAFDLIGATYSAVCVGPVNAGMLFFAIFFILLIGSYMFYHKRLAATGK